MYTMTRGKVKVFIERNYDEGYDEYAYVKYRYVSDGDWDVNTGTGWERFADFDVEPSKGSDAQERTVKQLIRKAYCSTYGGSIDSDDKPSIPKSEIVRQSHDY